MGKMLDNFKNKNSLKNMSIDEQNTLCEEIRDFLIYNVSKTGGHLASNLGIVELTVSLHTIFNTPKDSIVFDVGHQSYVHKILTGRKDKFNTLRKKDGLSGFTKKSESVHDAFISGHSGISISVALGISRAKVMKNDNSYTIALIGDGALTSGVAYEGLNNITKNDKNLIIVLNDNDMSISKNTGSMSSYLTNIRTAKSYFVTKKTVENIITNTPFVGDLVKNALSKSKTAFKTLVYDSNFFDDMGIKYIGPIDGHNIEDIKKALQFAKMLKSPSIIHIKTKKGKGYHYAENNPSDYHGVSTFNVKIGNCKNNKGNFSEVFGNELVRLANIDDSICAVTAAMTSGTGLTEFEKIFKERFFDVTIAEQHAVSFCGGLSSFGLKPVFCVYSTFIQRAVDQLIHDVNIQKLPIIFGIDRAGIVGDDGETHQGIFDIPILCCLDNFTVYSASNYNDVKGMLQHCVKNLNSPMAIRYPRGSESENISDYSYSNLDYDILKNNSDILVVTYGRIFSNVISAKNELLKDNINIDILKLNKIYPLNKDLGSVFLHYKHIIVFEECIKTGGIGQQLSSIFYLNNVTIKAIESSIVPQDTVNSTLSKFYLDEKGIVKTIKGLVL